LHWRNSKCAGAEKLKKLSTIPQQIYFLKTKDVMNDITINEDILA